MSGAVAALLDVVGSWRNSALNAVMTPVSCLVDSDAAIKAKTRKMAVNARVVAPPKNPIFRMPGYTAGNTGSSRDEMG